MSFMDEFNFWLNDDYFDQATKNELLEIKDKNGVNTSGSGIGHDITATLSGATNKTYTLNQFYNAPLNEYEFGTLSYKFYDLNEGEHTLTFRVWDIHNNSSSATIRFNVVKGKIIDIENLTNYPNPMSDNTNFTFEHNQKDNEINIQIRKNERKKSMSKIILTGDRPTGKLHVGHYVGSLKRRVELQNSGQFDDIHIMIADAQALTDNIENPEKMV